MNRIAIILILGILIIGMTPVLSFSSAQSGSFSDEYTTVTKANQDDENVTEEILENRIAIIDTSYGIIKFELFERRAPITTENYINLSLDGFYDGILFHRVIDDFVIQTGDPNTKDNNPYNDGSGGSGRSIPLEIHPELTHVDGAVGMARGADLDSAESQFYICDGPQHGLDGDYAVFGLVFEGIEVVRQIAQVETWGYKRPLLKDHPIEDVVMYSVFITENNSEFQYLPAPEEDDDWLFGNPFRLPGFEGGLLLGGIIIAMIILKKKKK